MSKRVTILALLAALPWTAHGLRAEENDRSAAPVREILVPFENLEILLENQPRRVLLSRSEYEELLQRAERTPEETAPAGVVPVSAAYEVEVADGRARVRGTLMLEVLSEGLQVLDLEVDALGIRAAALDEQSAALGRPDDGRLQVFVEGLGLHRLTLEFVTAVETSAALQKLAFRVPAAASIRMRLRVPGDVEVRHGMPVVARTYDAEAAATTFELLPVQGRVSLDMTLNNRLRQRDRLVLARGVVLAEVTESYERLHATFSMNVLHRPVEQFRFAIPSGFEVISVHAPLLSDWAIEETDEERALVVRMREPTSETTPVALVAARTPAVLTEWRMPRLVPLDTAGQATVLGVLLEHGLDIQALRGEHLVPIDTAALSGAYPASLLQAEAGGPGLRTVAGFYAPTGFADGPGAPTLEATFAAPTGQPRVTTNLLLTLGDNDVALRAGFAVRPQSERLFAIDLHLPLDWQVLEVTDAAGAALGFAQFDPVDAADAARVRIRLAGGVRVGEETTIYLHARRVPADWLSDWQTQQIAFPAVRVLDTERDVGAIAIQAAEDTRLFPDQLEGLTPLDEGERARFGLPGAIGGLPTLAYRYDAQPFRGVFQVVRSAPRITARGYSFVRIEPELLRVYHELAYQIGQARTAALSFSLPADTPPDLTIRALGDVTIKQSESRVVDERRIWTVHLASRQRGLVRLGVEYEQRQPAQRHEATERPLSLARAEDVTYQSGVVALEADSELDVAVITHPRRVDVGEVAPAAQPPWRKADSSAAGGLGVFAYAGSPADLTVRVARNTEYGLPVAIVQRAELVTLLSAEGIAQTAARLTLRTKPALFEIQLPAGAVFWSITLDGVAASPQREGQRLVLNLPSSAGDAVRDLQIVYETPLETPQFWDQVRLDALRLALRPQVAGAAAVEIPVADFDWHVSLPSGFDFVRQEGTLSTRVERPAPAAWTAARLAYRLAGGIQPFYLGQLPSVSAAREPAMRPPPPSAHSAIPYAGGAAVPAEEGKAVDPRLLQQLDALGYVGGDEIVFERDESAAPEPAGGMRGSGGSASRRAAAASSPQAASVTDKAAPAQKQAAGYWALTGVRSLDIQLEQCGETVSFHSLGRDPRLTLTLVDQRRVASLGWGLALLMALFGIHALRRSALFKARYVVGVALAVTLIPLLLGRPEWVRVLNPSFWAAGLLAVFYLLVAVAAWMLRTLRAWRVRVPVSSAASTTAVLLAVLVVADGRAEPPDPGPVAPDWSVLLAPPAPVDVPGDAIIVPYDGNGVPTGDGRVLVPYDQFVRLWQLAYPHDPVEPHPAPVRYALAGGSYTARLSGDDALLVAGTLEFDVYGDGPVAIPLRLAGGVFTQAKLDGAAARLGVAPETGAAEKRQDGTRFLLRVAGAGRHRLELAVRLQIERSGGWRRVVARLPVAPATALTLEVPAPATDVRIDGLLDRRTYETGVADERIATALEADGRLRFRWRPQVQAGRVDPSLTVASSTLFDVREDGLQFIWQAALDLGQSQRETFTIGIPADYQVHGVRGTNVRGWTAAEADTADAEGYRDLEVTLLKPATGREQVALVLRHTRPDGEAPFDVPMIRVRGAVLHKGTVVIRRSALLDLRMVATRGVSRSDVPENLETLAELAGRGQKSPLAVRAFQAYSFAATPFQIRLAAAAGDTGYTAEVQSVFRIAERQQDIEARFTIAPASYPVYHVRLALPGALRIERLSAVGRYEWSQTIEGDLRRVDVYLADGQAGSFSIVVQGTLADQTSLTDIALPQLDVPDAARQRRQMVVQADPAFDLRLGETSGIRRIGLDRVAWLNAGQRPLARLALSMDGAEYAGRLTLEPRRPIVQCTTISNVRVVDTTLEETILLTFEIRKAGIRAVSFTLPRWLETARISAPMLRGQRMEPVDDAPDAAVRVHLQFQDEVMGSLRVLVVHDRLLTADLQAVPIPTVNSVDNARRFIALETAGRDEVVIEESGGLNVLTSHHKAWGELASALGTDVTQAYEVSDDEAARLTYRTKQRVVVETAGARIGLARTVLSMDASGVYRAAQSYRIDNTTEQFLEVDLPDGAELWSAVVAGRPVKPARTPGAGRRRVRIPLIRTAVGDLDYEVALYYGGHLAKPGWLRSVKFPLMSTVNVPVELSQVRMYLPEDSSWFAFGGSLRQVSDRGDLAAGIIRYQTQVAERLAQALELGSSYTRSRAASSFKSLKSEIAQVQSGAAGLENNANVQRELQSSKEALARNEQQLADLDELEGMDPALSNRARLNDLYLGQRTERARNTLQSIGDNFADPQADALEKNNAFDTAWIEGSDLVYSVTDRPVQSRLKDAPQSGPARGATLQPDAPQLARMPDDARKRDAAGGRGLIDGELAFSQRAAGQYRQQLADRSDATWMASSDRLLAGVEVSGGVAISPQLGLSGVKVDLGTRGVIYDFTTPRGATTLTARAASRETLQNLERLALLIVVLLLVWVVYKNRHRLQIQRPRGIALAGLLSLLTGFLPLAGLALVLTACVMAARPAVAAVAAAKA